MTPPNHEEISAEERQRAADEKVRRVGGTGRAHRVEDKWGGYWQCCVDGHPYTFQVTDDECRALIHQTEKEG